MKSITLSQDATVTVVIGSVEINSSGDAPAMIGTILESGAEITLAEGSAITLRYDDGSMQQILAIQPPEQSDQTQDNDDDISLEQNDNIEFSQDQSDITLDDTLGIPLPSEGGDFITLERDGNELLASAGYDTIGINTATTPIEDPLLLVPEGQAIQEPTLTQSDVGFAPEDTTVTGNVLENDSDLDDVLSVQSFTIVGDPTIYLAGQTVLIEGGSIIITPDGNYTFIPVENFNGVVPIITYTTNTGASDTLTITISPVSDLADENEVLATQEDITVTGNVLENASSADGTPVVIDFTVNNLTFAAGATTELTEGQLTINGNGTYTFIPADNFNGPLPVVTYTVSDGVNTDISTITITVTPVSDLADGNETVTTQEDTTLTGNVLANASSADGTPVVTDFTVNNLTFAAGTTTELPEGQLTINGNGTYTFIPADNFNGPLPVVTYTVSDGVNTDISTITITVTPVSDLADGNETVTTQEDTTLTGTVLANASSADGTPVVTDFTVNNTTFAAGTTTALPEGQLTINGNGTYTFIPADNFNGPLPVVTYTVSDGVNTDISTITITVTPVSDLADGNETVTTQEDTTVAGNVLANASSADGTPVVTDFTVNNTTFAAGTTTELPEGQLTINGNGTYTFTPADNFNGPLPVVTYTVSDGVNTDISTITINVTPVSDLADGNETATTQEDITVTGNVLENASSADGTPVVTDFTVNNLTFAAGTTVALTEGQLTINGNGTYTFIPADNFNGSLPVVTYTVSDGVNTDISSITINVTPVSDLADGNETVTTQEDITVTGNVLENASSADGTPVVTDFTVNNLTFAAGTTTELTEGQLTINGNGTYTFIPADNFNGPLPVVTYTVSDGVNTDISTITINVTPVSDLADGNEIVTTQEDTTLTGTVLANASSADGTPVVADFTVNNLTFAAGTTTELPEGQLTINGDGTYTFIPADNFNGPLPVVTYTVSDGVNTDISSITINVTPVSDLADGNETVTTQEDTTLTGTVLANASSADGTPVVTDFTVNNLTFAAGTTTELTEGQLTINGNGTYTFIPADNFNGPLPVVTYTVSDGVNTDISTITINVTPVSDLADGNETVTTQEDTTLTGTVLANASSADGTPVVTDFTVNNITFAAGTTTELTEGQLTINGDGTYTFIPTDNFNGPLPVVTYTVSDGVNTDISSITINVTPVSDLADGNETVTTQEDTTLTGTVLANASSADGTPVVADFTVNNLTFAAGTTTELPEGQLTINGDGTYTFIPADNFNGPLPVVTYTVSDGVNTDISSITINVTPVSDLADGNETVTTQEDTTLTGTVLANASSADGTPVVTDFTVNNLTFAAGTTTELTEGQLTINGNGTYTFIPADNFNGPLPVVTYTVSDGVNTDISTITINVTPVSDLADGNETVTTQEDTTLTGTVLANASSADGTPVVTDFTVNNLTFAAGTTTELTEGQLTINGDGTYTFIPADNFNGPLPVVTYTVSDGVNTDISSITINVTPVSDLADGNETVTTQEDTTLTGTVLANASSADGTPVVTDFTVNNLTFAAGTTTELTEGQLTINGNGTYTFIPADNFNGPLPVVTYTVSDGVNTDISTITINVTPVSDLADGNETVTTQEDTTLTGTVLANASSADGTPVVTDFTVNNTTFAAGTTTELTEGQLTINGNGTYTFIPADNFNGPLPVVTYTVSDGVNTDISSINITVTPVNDAPVAEDDTFSVDEGESVSGNVITRDDGDGRIDSDGGDGAALRVTQVNGINLVFDPVSGFASVPIKDGILLIKADGTFTYNNAGYVLGSEPPSFEYTLSDGTDTDTGQVTINVIDFAPVANDDFNFVQTAENEVRVVVGDTIGRRNSSGDNRDFSVDGFGSPAITQVVYEGETFNTVDGQILEITTAYGTLEINSNGSYEFTALAGLNLTEVVALTFNYTIQDADELNPETDSADLVINLRPPANNIPVAVESVDDDSSTIDTAVFAESIAQNEALLVKTYDSESLGSILIDNEANGLEALLSNVAQEALSEDAQASVLIEINEQEISLLDNQLGALQSSDSIMVTNGLLENGGTILGDTAAAASPSASELDSPDVL